MPERPLFGASPPHAHPPPTSTRFESGLAPARGSGRGTGVPRASSTRQVIRSPASDRFDMRGRGGLAKVAATRSCVSSSVSR